MENRLDLNELGRRLKMVDGHWMAILAQRMYLGRLVEEFKRIEKQPLIRPQIEAERIEAAKIIAAENGLNPNFIASMLYFIIGETCRVEIEQLQSGEELPDLSQEKLKENLLALTHEIASSYDQTYEAGFFATRSYLVFEDTVIKREIGNLRTLNNLDLAIDLGCATGNTAFKLAEHFKKVVGYDISFDMVEEAKKKLRKNKLANLSFQVADIENGIPEESNSVSLVVMNLGTASDVFDIRQVLARIKRILKPDGRFILSFYNSSALLYRCWFIPWPVSLVASINQITHCLDVRFKSKLFSVHANPYSTREVKKFLQQAELSVSQIFTYPTISSILPNEFFDEDEMQNLIKEVDRHFIESETGAYLLVTGRKKV
ncbi:MAG: methyltransferase domain-containing protein [Candidatus Nealsonbacteria bacterium]